MNDRTIVTQDKLLKMVYDSGAQFEKDYSGCCQAVLYPFYELFDLHEKVIKAATSLSGGIARTAKGPCASFTGGAIAFGYYCGRGVNDLDKRELSKKTGELTRILQEKFIQEYGGYLCNEVQEKKFGRCYNLLNPDDYQSFIDDGAYTEKCPEVVGKAAVWIAEILLKESTFRDQLEKKYKLV